jgi:TolA-binding protein
MLQGDKAKAKEMFEKVVKDYPTNNNVQKAKEHWGKL